MGNVFKRLQELLIGEVARSIISLGIPMIAGGLSLLAGHLQGTPWAYAITAAVLATGGAVWLLNQIREYNDRTPESEEIAFAPFKINIGRCVEHNNDRALVIDINLVNLSKRMVHYNFSDFVVSAKRKDGTASRGCLPLAGGRDGVASAASPVVYRLPLTIIEDIIDDGVSAEMSVTVRFGRKKLKHEISLSSDIYITKQDDGNFSVVAREKRKDA